MRRLLDGQLFGDILMLHVMREYGWDFHTYMNQPAWVLELAHEKMKVESKLAAMAAEQKPHAQ